MTRKNGSRLDIQNSYLHMSNHPFGRPKIRRNKKNDIKVPLPDATKLERQKIKPQDLHQVLLNHQTREVTVKVDFLSHILHLHLLMKDQVHVEWLLKHGRSRKR